MLSHSLRRTAMPNLRSASRRFGAQPEAQSNRAKLWGNDNGVKHDWERPVQITYVLAGVILLVGVGLKPETSIKTWANGEARARKALGLGTVEFGKHYNQIDEKYQFSKDEIDDMPESDYSEKVVQRFNTSLHNRKL